MSATAQGIQDKLSKLGSIVDTLGKNLSQHQSNFGSTDPSKYSEHLQQYNEAMSVKNNPDPTFDKTARKAGEQLVTLLEGKVDSALKANAIHAFFDAVDLMLDGLIVTGTQSAKENI